MTRFNLIGIALLALLVLGGCQSAGGPRSAAGGSDVIEKRALERWNHLIAKRPEKAYDYLTPGYRKTVTRENYAAARMNLPIRWKAVAFNRKECDPEACTVFLSMDYEVTLPSGGAGPILSFAPLNERWIKVGKQWYYLEQK